MIKKGFTIGGAHSPYYDGQTLAGDHDVVVVTIKFVSSFLTWSIDCPDADRCYIATD